MDKNGAIVFDEHLDFKAFYDEKTKIISMPKKNIEILPGGIGVRIYEGLRKHFGRTCQIDVGTGEIDSFDDVYTRSARSAIKLQNLGIKPGDVISLCSHNHINCTPAFISTLFVGAISASLDPGLSEEDMEHLISQVTPKLFFVSPDCEQRIAAICKKLKLDAKFVVFGDSADNLEYADFLMESEQEANFKPYEVEDLEDTCIIMFSSGSTGLPKSTCFSHKFFTYHSTGSQPVPNFMFLASFYWTSANHITIAQIRNGFIKSFSSKFDPELLWEQIKTYKISVMQLMPHEAMEFIDAKPENWDGSLMAFIIVGSAVGKDSITMMRKALPTTLVNSLFAMTETALIFYPGDLVAYEKLESVGVPVAGIQYKIVDLETEENLGYNQRGELRVKSDYFLKGFHNRDSSDIWDEEGFLKTGDVVYFDEDFCFFVVDRVREMFKYRQYHIYPAKYEPILLNHPEICSAVIIPTHHSVDNNHIMAVVVPKKGSAITPKEVEDYYNGLVDDNCRIRAGVKFLDHMPVTPSGKINRKEVKLMV